ncbi:hypothetical protein GTO27_10810 [Candidatus Bathyarchaeota archaeon]|nr:hypothetical protein [Candidatus Bathyarchaeota archaeon]
MSRGEAPLGLTIMEKLIGFFIMLIGIIIFYVTYTNISSIRSHPIIFLVAGLILIGLGIVMLTAKTE